MKMKRFKISRASRLVRFPLLGMILAVQGPVFGRPQWFYSYNDGYSAFRDFGPIRIYRYFWREGK